MVAFSIMATMPRRYIARIEHKHGDIHISSFQLMSNAHSLLIECSLGDSVTDASTTIIF